MGASNLGNFRNKNKHNISAMTIPLPPVYLTLSTTSDSLTSTSSTDTHYFHH